MPIQRVLENIKPNAQAVTKAAVMAIFVPCLWVKKARKNRAEVGIRSVLPMEKTAAKKSCYVSTS
jgi:hypothetical protein